MEVIISKQNVFWLILSIGFFILMMSTSLALMYFFYRKRLTDHLLRAKNIELEKKTELLEARIRGEDLERQKIATAIHDELSSKLAVLQITIEHLLNLNDQKHNEESNLITETIEKLIESTESISHGLLPPDLEYTGLVGVISGVVSMLQKKSEIDIQFTFKEEEIEDRNMDEELGVYRIFYELLHNTLKYSNAKNIVIYIELTSLNLSLQYSDDGVGFDLESAMEKGIGIKSIISRAQYLSSEYIFNSSLGNGMEFKLKTTK